MKSSQLNLLLQLPTDGQPVELCFSRTVILHNDPASFMEVFSWERLRYPELLSQLHGRIRFRFEGYMGDSRGFEQIPELRTFLRDWHRAWPAWAESFFKMLQLIAPACFWHLIRSVQKWN